ncbi:MAG: hypothetical protein ACLRSW_17770 [Christensenellaceae bacterium]
MISGADGQAFAFSSKNPSAGNEAIPVSEYVQLKRSGPIYETLFPPLTRRDERSRQSSNTV